MAKWKLVDAGLAPGAEPEATIEYNKMLAEGQLDDSPMTKSAAMDLEQIVADTWGDFYSLRDVRYYQEPVAGDKVYLAKVTLVSPDGTSTIEPWYRKEGGLGKLSGFAKAGIGIGIVAAVIGGVMFYQKSHGR